MMTRETVSFNPLSSSEQEQFNAALSDWPEMSRFGKVWYFLLIHKTKRGISSKTVAFSEIIQSYHQNGFFYRNRHLSIISTSKFTSYKLIEKTLSFREDTVYHLISIRLLTSFEMTWLFIRMMFGLLLHQNVAQPGCKKLSGISIRMLIWQKHNSTSFTGK